MRQFLCVALLAALLCGAAVTRSAAEPASDMDKVTTYAELLGRGISCGFDMKEQTRRVGTWIDHTFTGQDMGLARKQFVTGMQQGVKKQAAEPAEESCPRLQKTLNEVTWP